MSRVEAGKRAQLQAVIQPSDTQFQVSSADYAQMVEYEKAYKIPEVDG